MFIDYSRLGAYKATPIYNSLSDHDVQLILIHDITFPSSSKNYCNTRKIDKFSLADFNYKLSFEIWSDVFEGNDVNIIFNSFLNIFLRYVYASFPKSSAKSNNIKNNMWITSNIKTKCNVKRHLYLISRNSNDPNIKKIYKTYSKSLARYISKTKHLYYDMQISNSNDRIKSTWYIKSLSGRNSHIDILPTSSITCATSTTNTFVTALTNPVNITESFNEYFLYLANTIITSILSNTNNCNPTDNAKTYNDYLSTTLNETFPSI
jgi:hypothetical protein